jgi:hypothetical protein
MRGYRNACKVAIGYYRYDWKAILPHSTSRKDLFDDAATLP